MCVELEQWDIWVFKELWVLTIDISYVHFPILKEHFLHLRKWYIFSLPGSYSTLPESPLNRVTMILCILLVLRDLWGKKMSCGWSSSWRLNLNMKQAWLPCCKEWSVYFFSVLFNLGLNYLSVGALIQNCFAIWSVFALVNFRFI